jgi:type I restriction enzyme S subunit
MSDWREASLGEVAEGFLSGGTPATSTADFWDGEIPWITSKWLGRKLELTDGEKLISEEAIRSSATKIVPKNSIIFATRVGVGKVGINRVDLAINQDLAGILIDNEKHDIKFLAYQLCLDSIQKYVEMNKRGATIKGITRNCLEKISLNLPPLPEQKAIAHALSTVQRAIEAQERIIQTTTELKKALMQKLFSEGLRGEPQKETEIGMMPESWEVVPLSAICSFLSGGTPSKQNPYFWQGSIPWVSPKDMKRPRLSDAQDHISEEALQSGSKLAPAGSVLVVVRGMILAKTVPVALAEVPMAINQDIKAIVPGASLSPDFLLYALETLRDSLFRRVGRSGHGTCTLMGHEVAAFRIPLPSIEEQNAIAAAALNLELKIKIHQAKREQLQAAFQTLLVELMAAKTRVHRLDFSNKTTAITR